MVARIGAEDLMLSEIMGIMYSLPEEQRTATPFESLYEQILQERIDQSLVYNAAVAEGLRESPSHIRRMIDIERRILTDTYLQREIGALVSEAALQERYEQVVADAANKTEMRARRIRTANQAEAREVYARIRAGEDFADIARSLSFPGADRGGDLGYFSEANMLAPIVAVARQLETGQVSPPFPTEYGWHLIKLEDIRAMPVPPFDQLRESLYRNLREEAAQAVLTQLRSAHPVERFARDGSPLDPAEQAR